VSERNPIDESTSSKSRRLISPHKRSLPGPKAVIGGFLVAIAALGTYATASGAIGANSRQVVVAAADLQPGHNIEPEDLRLIELDVPASLGRNVASSVAQLDNTTLVGPVAAGEVIQAGNVVARSSSGAGPEIAVALPPADALGGKLKSGETVDVLSTHESDGALADTAVRDALVVGVDDASSGLGAGGDIVVTLAVRDRAQASAIAAAAGNDAISLVRTTGLGGR
jgi:Flp pilus assembly protein CpaB